MKYLLIILLVINPFTDLDKIARINKAKKEAEKAYLQKNYALAREKYLFLKDSLGVEDDRVLLNLANSQYLLNDTTNAWQTYASLQESANKEIRSIAYQQMGAIQFQQKKYQEALQSYKAALKANPDNADARYNYELLKKLTKEQEEQQDKQQNKEQQNKDQENKEQQNKEQQQQQDKDQNKEQQQQQEKQEQQQQEKQEQEQQDKQQQEQEQQQDKQQQENKEQKQQQEEQKAEDQQQEEQDKGQKDQPQAIDEEKLKEMKISEEKARLILEAMKNNEVQYLQQNRRKAKKKKDPNKPDW